MITFYILSLIISKYFVIDQLYFSLSVFRFYNLQTLFPANSDSSHLSLLWKVVCNNAGCIYNQLFIEKLGFIYPYFDKINILLFSLLVFSGSLFFIFYKNKKKHCNNSLNKELKNSKSSDLYSDFAPIDLGENDEHYEQIKFALEDENVKNLAILGSFGSGKSSVINSFFNNKDVYGSKIQPDEYVKVSFADFDYVNLNEEHTQNSQIKGNEKDSKESVTEEHTQNSQIKGNEKDSKESVTEEHTQNSQIKGNEKDTKESVTEEYSPNSQSGDNGERSKEHEIKEDKIPNNNIKSNKLSLKEVEYEIVRQLFHSNLIKDNKFANVILSYPSKIDTFVHTFILFVLIIAIFGKSLRDSYFSLYSTSIFLFCLTTILFIPFLYLSVSYFSRKLKLNKTSFGTVSLDFSEKNKLGAIDSYLNDIIYLFENSNCKFVILEDLDRTQNYEVFTHLRNLNFVLNNRLSCFTESRSQRSRIVFIYLLDDCIFSNPEEQVKFFDYSVSIIPAVSATTAGQVFLNKRDGIHKCYCPKQIITDQFLLSISRYITDIRLINKIFNDYLLAIRTFAPILQFNDGDDEREPNESQKQLIKVLFSLVLVRALYPREYHNLLLEKGLVYSILNRKYENLSITSVKTVAPNLPRYNFKDLVDKNKIDLSVFTKLVGCNSELLIHLLYSNSLSGCYRFFTSKTFKSKNNNKYLSSEAISYLLELYIDGNEYRPGRSLSIKDHFQVFFYYVPKFLILNNALFNYEFFENLIEDRVNFDYVSFIRRYFVEIYKNSYGNVGYAFIVDLIYYFFRGERKIASLKIAHSFFDHLFYSYRKCSCDNKANEQIEGLEYKLFSITFKCFCDYHVVQPVSYDKKFEEIDKFYLFVLVFLNSYSDEIEKIAKKNGVLEFTILIQNYLHNNINLEILYKKEILMSTELFFSMRQLNVNFKTVPFFSNNLSKEDFLNFFYKFLNLAVYRDSYVQAHPSNTNKCYFGFEANGNNFKSIAKSFMLTSSNVQDVEYGYSDKFGDCLITVFLDKYNDKLKLFYCNLFYHIFVFKNYDLIFELLDLYRRINEEHRANLNDNLVPFLLFITFLNYYPTIEELSSNSYVSGLSLQNSFSREHYANNKNDILKLCFSVSDGVKNHEAVIHFLLILEQFQDEEQNGSFLLYKPCNLTHNIFKTKSTNSFNAVKEINIYGNQIEPINLT